MSKLHDSAPGASGLRASAWKALADDRTTFDLIRNFVIEFWESEGSTLLLGSRTTLYFSQERRPFFTWQLPRDYDARKVRYRIIGHILLARLKVIKENFKHLGT